MRSRAPKDAVPWHKSGMKGIAAWVISTGTQETKGVLLPQLPQPIAWSTTAPGHRSGQPLHFSQKTFRSRTLRWQRDCSSLSEPCALIPPPAAPGRVLFRIPNGFTESVPKAFCCCKLPLFLYIEDYRAVSCGTSGLADWGVFAVCCWFSEQCAPTGAFWPCNRIHRNGG
jgi:hypothetical protein